jgi:hypothetical protein
MRIMILLASLAFLVSAQTFFEATGKTAVFTMKDGARTSQVYHGGTSGERALPVISTPLFTAFFSGGICYRIHSPSAAKNARLSLFDLNGRRLFCHPVNGLQGRLPMDFSLANGVYLLRLETVPRGPATAVKIAVLK